MRWIINHSIFASASGGAVSAKVHVGNISRLMSYFTFDNGYLLPMAAGENMTVWNEKCDTENISLF